MECLTNRLFGAGAKRQTSKSNTILYAVDKLGYCWYPEPIEIPRKHFDIFLFERNEHGDVHQVTDARLNKLKKAMEATK